MSSSNIITVPEGRMISVGVLGAGRRARERWVPAHMQLGGYVAAIADADVERAQSVADEHDIPHTFSSLDQMLAALDLDALIVALDPAEQAEAVVHALERGLHVMCDAPFGCNGPQAQRMIAAARKARKVLAAGYHHPWQQFGCLEYARTPGIGMPNRIVGRLPGPIDGPGQVSWGKSTGRGTGADPGSHLLSVALPLAKAAPVAVSAVGWGARGGGEPGPVLEDEALLDVVVDFRNGARGHFLAGSMARVGGEPDIDCSGSQGTLRVSLLDDWSEAGLDLQLFRPGGTGRKGETWRGDPPPSILDAHMVQLVNWMQACRSRTALLHSDPQRAVEVHAVLDAAYRSIAAMGARINLPRT